jgi:hypothetical protein
MTVKPEKLRRVPWKRLCRKEAKGMNNNVIITTLSNNASSSSQVKHRLSTKGKGENHTCKFMTEGICPSGLYENSNIKKPEIKKY